MSETNDPTHYQIALTSRQVLTAFAVLLGCLFAVFFAGVWLGRTAAEDGPGYGIADGAGDDSGDRVSFFGSTSPATEAASEPEQATESREPSKEAPARRKPAPEPPPAPTPEASSRQTPPPPEPMERPSRPESTTPAATSTAAPASDGFYIQVFASAQRDKAQDLVTRLVGADLEASLSPVGPAGREVYRVRVGPFADRASAERQAQDLRTRWQLNDSWIVSPDS